MANTSQELHHVNEESHEILQLLEEAFSLCSDEGERIRKLAEEDSYVTQEIERLDQKHSMSRDQAKGLEQQLAKIDNELEASEKEAKKMLEALDKARNEIEKEMEEISEIVR